MTSPMTRIRVLMSADLVALYAMWVMTTYLTDVWKLSITHAAGLLNIWGGVVLTLPIGLKYLVDSFLGNYPVLAGSSIAFSIGLCLLCMSTPPVLSKFTGTCSEYLPECIGHTQKALFYTALALIAIGRSGHIVSLQAFEEEQSERTAEAEEDNRIVQRPKKREVILALVAAVGGIALPYIKPWSIRFGIPAIFTLVATIIFLSCSRSYKRVKPKGSALTNIFRVIVASASNMSKQLPSNPKDLYKAKDRRNRRLRHTDGLRCLDKAAIKLLNHESNNRWRLCTVTEVEETKIAIRMIPMWMTFIMCGVIASAGNTYFREQANHLSRQVGKLKVPVPILLLLQDYAKPVFSGMYRSIKTFLMTLHLGRYAPSVGIAGAMILTTLCCITAAKVEARRLDVIRSHDLIEKPEETIPMNIFWVAPQFELLAGLESFFKYGVTDFFSNQSPTLLAKYLVYFTHGVSGLGFMAGVLSVYVVGKISESGGKSNWFQYTLNKSRLDNYFWILAALSAVNFVVYILVACMFPYRQTSASDGEQPENGEDDHGFYGEDI